MPPGATHLSEKIPIPDTRPVGNFLGLSGLTELWGRGRGQSGGAHRLGEGHHLKTMASPFQLREEVVNSVTARFLLLRPALSLSSV